MKHIKILHARLFTKNRGYGSEPITLGRSQLKNIKTTVKRRCKRSKDGIQVRLSSPCGWLNNSVQVLIMGRDLDSVTTFLRELDAYFRRRDFSTSSYAIHGKYRVRSLCKVYKCVLFDNMQNTSHTGINCTRNLRPCIICSLPCTDADLTK